MTEDEIIAAGRAALSRVHENEATSFADWCSIGRAVRIGRREAMVRARVNAPKGSVYALHLRDWLNENGLTGTTATERHWAIYMADHEAEIAAWRDTLPEAKRRKFVTPHGICNAWQNRAVNSMRSYNNAGHHRPTWKGKGAAISFTQDHIRRAATAMRENWCNDTFRLARVALEAAIRTEADLQELIPQPKPAKTRQANGFDILAQHPA
ncbi:hypothetical protein ACQR1Y_12430 [Bradyrhizobium sp. HKCCYLRH3099]|uniref:hypothetical protein n=1 Tax=Bradyrhizobium TaxID=374 RepID=UPI003EB7C59F